MTALRPFTAHEHQRIQDAVAAVEKTTAADLDIVVVRVSDHYSMYPLLGAALGALLLTGLLIVIRPAVHARFAFMFQVLILGVLAAFFDWMPIRLRLVPERVKRAHARQLAHREFSTGHARGGQRNRILLFVSIGERYVEIIADHETHAAVEGLAWDQMVSNFVAKVKTGRIADGVLAAIESCGAVLGRRHPVASGR